MHLAEPPRAPKPKLVLLALSLFVICTCASAMDSAYWLERGDVLVESGSYEEALEMYDEAIRIDPGNMDAWARRAMVLGLLERQAWMNLLHLSEKRVADNPDDARAWQAHAAALMWLGRVEEANQSRKRALGIYEREVQKDPENATAWFYKAELTANRTEALMAYNKVIELNGSMKMAALLTKSNILLNLGRPDEALRAIDEAIELDPKSTRAWEERAITCYLLGRYNESLAAYERIIELRSGNVPAWIWKGKGDALKALGRQAEADAAYAKARELGYLV